MKLLSKDRSRLYTRKFAWFPTWAYVERYDHYLEVLIWLEHYYQHSFGARYLNIEPHKPETKPEPEDDTASIVATDHYTELTGDEKLTVPNFSFEPVETPQKRTYRCGKCGTPGHTAKKCPKANAAGGTVTPSPVASIPADPVRSVREQVQELWEQGLCEEEIQIELIEIDPVEITAIYEDLERKRKN